MKSWVELSGAKLSGNFRAVRAVVGEHVEVLAVIKANAYGHGAAVCAPVLADAGAHWLGVSDVSEGEAVRALVDPGVRILIMCGMETGDAAAIVAHGLTPVVWTAEHLAALEAAASAAGARVKVHLEIETGMARQGAALGPELQHVLDTLNRSKWIACEGVMTHLCCAEIAEAKTTRLAEQRFEAALEQITQAAILPEYVHVGNTSAVDEGGTMAWVRALAEKYSATAMVRPGFAIYGHCLPVEGGTGRLIPALSPVLEWKTRIIGLREIEAGATVGYSATFVATRPMRLALLPVGYADGFRRAGSSGIGDGWVIIAGSRADIVGRVSMNLTVVDVSGLEVAVGDEVVLLGAGVSAEDHAAWSATIPYDILCGIRARFALV